MTLRNGAGISWEGNTSPLNSAYPVPWSWAHSHCRSTEGRAVDLSLIRRGRGPGHFLNCNLRQTLMNQEGIDLAREIFAIWNQHATKQDCVSSPHKSLEPVLSWTEWQGTVISPFDVCPCCLLLPWSAEGTFSSPCYGQWLPLQLLSAYLVPFDSLSYALRFHI